MPGDGASADTQFGVLLRTLRERAGLTQQELAERADLTPHAVSSLERGTRTRPYPHTVRSLADALGASEDERASLVAAVRRRKPPIQPTARPADLVIPPTPLFGRDDDIAAVTGLIRSGARLVTLTGPGGVGKTRLMVAVSDVLGNDFADGVVRVSLAPLADASTVVATIGRAFGIAGIDAPGAFDLVAAHVWDSQLLLVLDNFEHLLSAAVDVGQLIALCPAITVLVSSRSPLRVRGEHEYVVEPLGLPLLEANTVDELRAHPAGALVLDRAQSVRARPAADDVPAYAELCHRLAGLPLAIELAITQLRLLSPAALLERLESASTSSGARDLPARQRTMRATLDWSYGLLDQEQQQLFTMLGVFRGGATLEAVEAVAEATGEFAGGDVLGVLRELAEHSLVHVRGTRLDLLEPVAQYARSLLVGDRAARALADRGSEWMASLVHVWLGGVHLLRGDAATAVPEIERGLRLARTRGDRLSTYVALYNLSQAALALGDYALARDRVREGITLSRETRDLANLAYFVETLAVIESRAGGHHRVATLLGAATGLRETVGADVYAFYLPDEHLRSAAEKSARTALGDEVYDDAVDAGRSLDPAAVAELTTRV